MSKEKARRISRRDFVKGTALGAGALAGAGALTGCGPAAGPAPAGNIPQKWDKEADVVVVGLGGAGASTAITAHDEGAKVLVLEKAPEGEEGGNTRVSGNLWFNPTPADAAATYLKAMADGFPIPDDMVQVWADEMGKNTDWVRSLGGDPSAPEPQSSFCSPEFPELPGAECSTTYFATPGGWGEERLWNVLKPAVDERGIEVAYATAGKELVQNSQTKEILGIIAETDGGTIAVKAKKAVVLTCGGFENSPEMIQNFLALPKTVPLGTPYNTGDGITMVQRVGAALWHMGAQAGMSLHFQIPGTDSAAFLGPSVIAAIGGEGAKGWIYVNGDGQRFLNELIRDCHGYVNLNSVWRPKPVPEPAYLIFDEKMRRGGPMMMPLACGWGAQVLNVTWSPDNSEEIAKGWILKGDTLADLAAAIEVDASSLEATVSKFNGYAQAGEDAEFGRLADQMGPLEEAPFYAMPLARSILNTQGGAKRNTKAQIVDPDENPIPRLYSAGEFGSIYSYLYNGGGNVGETMAFGRIAGRNAAAEQPWS
jgi:succinate dehydrogenase/fumarate reductase flavoprotein subunit